MLSLISGFQFKLFDSVIFFPSKFCISQNSESDLRNNVDVSSPLSSGVSPLVPLSLINDPPPFLSPTSHDAAGPE